MPSDIEKYKTRVDLKKVNLPNESSIIRQYFVGGCSYLIKKVLVDFFGPVGEQKTNKIYGWTARQEEISSMGFAHGYISPIVYVDHMDDPRSSYFDKSEDNLKICRNTMSMRKIKIVGNDLSPIIKWIESDAALLLGDIPKHKDKKKTR